MAIFLNILLLLVGFVLLIKGADFFVDGSSSVARHLGIPAFVVGLTIVAMGKIQLILISNIFLHYIQHQQIYHLMHY